MYEEVQGKVLFDQQEKKKKKIFTSIHKLDDLTSAARCSAIPWNRSITINFPSDIYPNVYCYVRTEKAGIVEPNRRSRSWGGIASLSKRFHRLSSRSLIYTEARQGRFKSASSILRSCNDRYCTVTLGQGSRRDRIGISRPLRSAIFRVFSTPLSLPGFLPYRL